MCFLKIDVARHNHSALIELSGMRGVLIRGRWMQVVTIQIWWRQLKTIPRRFRTQMTLFANFSPFKHSFGLQCSYSFERGTY
ncbi:hypothetical protein BSK63_24980 [Paenibacillus odorifer]|nr:hypothetical protein BSK57_27045 [Paenibacillus odorifer]OME28135.1 hypothetical protein BSK63_24980 [Paenibacillus odorifer]OME31309.1 hypothetical protein BSK46_25650 [Paenibacillus odorifer]